MKNAKRFVFDTNVLIRAMLSPGSLSARSLRNAVNVGTVVVSKECMEELSRMALYEKFDKYSSFSKRQMFVLDFGNAAELVEIKYKITLSRDPDDNKFLSLAKSAKAACIVTGDNDLLVLHPFGSIAILKPSEFLKKY